jgi:hypothetical protein
MHRRTVLRATGASLAAGALPVVSTPRATGRAPFEPLSRRSLPGAKEAVVGDDGTTTFVATTDGFATVDVADPGDPVVVAERRDLLADRDTGPLGNVRDLAVDGDLLAVAGPANGSGLSGVLLYDVATPADPQQLAFHETSHAVHNCDVADGLVALTGNNGADNPTVFVDVTEPGRPREVGRWSLYEVDETWSEVHLGARSIHDVTLVDGVAYCAHWDAGTWLLDVADPAAPTPLGHLGGFTPDELLSMSDVDKGYQTLEPPGNAHYAEVNDDGTVLAVGGESWDGRTGDGHGGPSGIDVWDVTDPEAPELLATVDPLVPKDATREGTWTTAHNFELVGDRLYSSWYHNGVKIHDVSDPTAPRLLAHWRRPGETRFWTARLGRAGEFFVASDVGTRGGDEDAALYTFPDHAGDQPDQPAIATATPTSTADSTTQSNSPETPTAESPGRTPTSAPTLTPTATTEAHAPTNVTTPGLGALAALGGFGLAGWRLVRGRE